MPGKGKMQITGQLGNVMQESVKAAKSYIRSKSLEFCIIPPIFDKKDEITNFFLVVINKKDTKDNIVNLISEVGTVLRRKRVNQLETKV